MATRRAPRDEDEKTKEIDEEEDDGKEREREKHTKCVKQIKNGKSVLNLVIRILCALLYPFPACYRKPSKY